jgi:hypothetical protein
MGHDSAFADWITDLLDRRVLRVRDRGIVRDLTGLPPSDALRVDGAGC